MEVKQILLYTTIIMFIITWVDPMDTHIYNAGNIIYKGLLLSQAIIFVITCYFMNIGLPVISIIGANLAKMFVSSHPITPNELMALYFRLNNLILFIILAVIIVNNIPLLKLLHGYFPKIFTSKPNITIALLLIPKIALTIVPTFFRYDYYLNCAVVAIDVIRCIALLAYIVATFISDKKTSQPVKETPKEKEPPRKEESRPMHDFSLIDSLTDSDDDDDDSNNDNNDNTGYSDIDELDFDHFMDSLARN